MRLISWSGRQLIPTTELRRQAHAFVTKGPVKRALLLVAVLAFQFVVVAATYHGVESNGFVRGERGLIADRLGVEVLPEIGLGDTVPTPVVSPRNAGGPLADALYAYDWNRSGGDAPAFHETNVRLLQAAALAVFFLIYVVLERVSVLDPALRIYAALGGALLWATHPLLTATTLSVMERPILLTVLFTAAATAFYLKGRQDDSWRPLWLVPAAVCVVLALMSRDTGWVAPVLLVVAEWTLVRTQGAPSMGRPGDIPVLIGTGLILAYFLVGGVGGFGPLGALDDTQPAPWDVSLGQRLLSHPRIVWFHISQFVVPLSDRFAIDHGLVPSQGLFQPITTLPAILGMLVWLGASGWMLWHEPLRPFAFPLLWVAASLAVEQSALPVDLGRESSMAVPCVAFALLFAKGFSWVLQRGRVEALASGAIVFILVGATMAVSTTRIPVWASDLTLYRDAHRRAAESPRANFYFAEALWRGRRGAEATDHFRFVTDHEPRIAGSLKVQQAHARYRLGVIARTAGDNEAARRAFVRAIGLDPRHVQSYASLASIAVSERRLADAENHLRRMVRLRPRDAVIQNDLGGVLIELGRLDEARDYLVEALRIDPDLRAAEANLRLLDRLRQERGAGE